MAIKLRMDGIRAVPLVDLVGDHETEYLSLAEHQHLLAEKENRIERLREALRYYAGYMSGDAIEFTESGWQKYPDPKIAAAALQEETK